MNIIPELPAAAVRQGKKKDTKTGKEDIKLLSLAEKVMFYVENAKESETKLLAVISVFSKGCRMLDQYKHRSRFSLLMQSMWKPKLQNNAIYKPLLRSTLNKTHEGSLCRKLQNADGNGARKSMCSQALLMAFRTETATLGDGAHILCAVRTCVSVCVCVRVRACAHVCKENRSLSKSSKPMIAHGVIFQIET